MQTSPLVKALIVAALLAVVISLAVALVRLVRGQGSGVVKALTWRIGLSLLLFALLMVGMLAGVVVPHGVIP